MLNDAPFQFNARSRRLLRVWAFDVVYADLLLSLCFAAMLTFVKTMERESLEARTTVVAGRFPCATTTAANNSDDDFLRCDSSCPAHRWTMHVGHMSSTHTNYCIAFPESRINQASVMCCAYKVEKNNTV